MAESRSYPLDTLPSEEQLLFRRRAEDSRWLTRQEKEWFLQGTRAVPGYLVRMAAEALAIEEDFWRELRDEKPGLEQFVVDFRAWLQDPDKTLAGFSGLVDDSGKVIPLWPDSKIEKIESDATKVLEIPKQVTEVKSDSETIDIDDESLVLKPDPPSKGLRKQTSNNALDKTPLQLTELGSELADNVTKLEYFQKAREGSPSSEEDSGDGIALGLDMLQDNTTSLEAHPPVLKDVSNSVKPDIEADRLAPPPSPVSTLGSEKKAPPSDGVVDRPALKLSELDLERLDDPVVMERVRLYDFLNTDRLLTLLKDDPFREASDASWAGKQQLLEKLASCDQSYVDSLITILEQEQARFTRMQEAGISSNNNPDAETADQESQTESQPNSTNSTDSRTPIDPSKINHRTFRPIGHH